MSTRLRSINSSLRLNNWRETPGTKVVLRRMRSNGFFFFRLFLSVLQAKCFSPMRYDSYDFDTRCVNETNIHGGERMKRRGMTIRSRKFCYLTSVVNMLKTWQEGSSLIESVRMCFELTRNYHSLLRSHVICSIAPTSALRAHRHCYFQHNPVHRDRSFSTFPTMDNNECSSWFESTINETTHFEFLLEEKWLVTQP